MKAIRELRVIALVAVTAALAACGSDSSVAPEHQPADLGTVLSEMTLPAVASSFAPIPPLPAGALVPSTCSYNAASQSFTCPTVSASGLTLTRSFTLLSASGTPQSQFDPATTAAVRTISTTTGTLAFVATTISIDGEDDVTLSGILTGVHVLNGTSLMKMSWTDAGSTTPGTMTTSTTITNLVLPATASDKWPKSGQIIMDLTGSELGAAGAEHITMTFNGTSKVVVTMTSGGMSFNCTIDLNSQSPTCG